MARENRFSSEHAVCVWIPLFALRAEERRRPELCGHHAAVLSAGDTRRLWQVSPAAKHAGVKPGMTVSQSIGLCATLTLLEADPVHYDEVFSRIVLALSNVSPVVEPAELGRIYVGVDGLEKLIGDPQKVLAVIDETLSEAWSDKKKRRRWRRKDKQESEAKRGDNVWRLGWARGKFATWVAATRAKPGTPVVITDDRQSAFLQQQRIGTLPLEPDTHRRLWQLGLRTLSDLTTLPEQAVVSQFGREGRMAWRLAAGLVVEPVTGQEAPQVILASMDFPTPIADQGVLANTINKLIEQALSHPQRIGWRVRSVRALATLEHDSSWMVDATLKDPSADRNHIAAPILTKLEQTPPGGGIEHLLVQFTAFVRGTKELQLFARDAEAAARTGRRRALRWAAHEIKTRLNRTMLHNVIEVYPCSRIPERRYALIDFDP